MIVDRFVGYVIRLRGFLTWCWPFLLAAAVTANLIVLPLLVVRQADVLREAKASTESDRRLIERGLPCNDKRPDSESCQARDFVEAGRVTALAEIQGQHDAQSQLLADAINRLNELQARQHGAALPPPVVPPSRPRVATTVARPTATPTTTTTTVCKPPACKPNKP